MGVRRTLRLSQNVGNTNTFQYSTHSTTGYNSCTVRSGLDEHFSTTELGSLFVRNSTLQHGNLNEVLLGCFNALGNSGSYLTSLTKTPTNDAILVTNYDNCRECEGTTTLCYLSNTVDGHQSVLQLYIA